MFLAAITMILLEFDFSYKPPYLSYPKDLAGPCGEQLSTNADASSKVHQVNRFKPCLSLFLLILANSTDRHLA
jgi:hypothetical protein